jgi:DNA-binding response OmpR family regulator
MDERYSAAFTGWEVAFARTLAQAHQALDAGSCAVVVTGVYFDDSRMFDLVRALRSGEAHREVPIVCVRGCQGFTAVTTRTLELTVGALAANDFLDLAQFGDVEAGNAALRAAVQRFLGD